MGRPRQTYTIKLIRPKQKLKHYSTQYEMARMMGKKTANAALALPTLAALTPEHYDIAIVDEEMGENATGKKADIVGISMITSNSERGYEIADHYRRRGIKVVLGGPYASYSPEEALEHADAVVIGEAEEIWQQVLHDFEQGQLQSNYQGKKRNTFQTTTIPRWDLVDTNKILSINIQASRGCPFQCEFCLTSQLFGKKVRRRLINNVVEEIKQVPLKNLFFVDDNLTLNKYYALELFEAIKPLGVSWMCQSSVDVADDPDFLKKMAEAGCKYILIGFESINEKSLKETHKHQNNKDRYLEIIERIHQAGIHVYASFIIGFDHDTKADFQHFQNFIQEAGLPVFMLSLLGSTKGTALHARLEKEGRLYNRLSKNYNVGAYPVLKHPKMSGEELFSLYNQTIKELFRFDKIRERSISMLEKGYFSKSKENGSITVRQKISSTFTMLSSYYFSRDREKRRFFKDIIRLIKLKKLAINEAASILLMIEGIVRHIKKTEKEEANFYQALEKADSLPNT